jgi:hypothetical protein
MSASLMPAHDDIRSVDPAELARLLSARLPDKIKAFIEEKQGDRYVYRASIMLVDTWLGQTLQPDDALLSACLVGADGIRPLVPPRGFPQDASRYVVEEATVPVLYDKKGTELTYVEPVGDGRHWRLVTLRELEEGPVFGWLTLDEVEAIYRLVGERHLPLKIAVEKMRTLNQPRMIFWTIPPVQSNGS